MLCHPEELVDAEPNLAAGLLDHDFRGRTTDAHRPPPRSTPRDKDWFDCCAPPSSVVEPPYCGWSYPQRSSLHLPASSSGVDGDQCPCRRGVVNQLAHHNIGFSVECQRFGCGSDSGMSSTPPSTAPISVTVRKRCPVVMVSSPLVNHTAKLACNRRANSACSPINSCAAAVPAGEILA